MISPVDYRTDVIRTFSHLFNHQLNSIEEMNKKRVLAENLWKTYFPQDPFHLEEDKNEILKKYRYSLSPI